MNFKNKLRLGALLGAALLGLPVIQASAQVSPLTLTTLTNFPATLAAGATSTVTNLVSVPRNGGMAFQAVLNAASGTAGVGVQGSFSVDGTNFGTSPFLIFGNANSTTKVVIQTNWSQAQLAGFNAVNFTTWTNSAANGILTNGAGVLTNGGMQVNRVFYNY